MPPVNRFRETTENDESGESCQQPQSQALTILARRLPTLHRAGIAPRKPMLGMTGPTRLPVEFDIDAVVTASA